MTDVHDYPDTAQRAKKTNAKLPILEAAVFYKLSYNLHFTLSWSYGILIGEVVSYGDVPWPKHSQTDIRRAMRKGIPPEPPHNTYFPL